MKIDLMTNTFDVTRATSEGENSGTAAPWVKPTLDRLSLKDALTNGTHHTDGTVGGNTSFS